MKFRPVNRHILIEKEAPPEVEKSKVLIPIDYKPKSDKYIKVKVLKAADTCLIHVYRGDRLVVREPFIEEITIEGETFYLVLENHIMGVLKHEKNH